MVRGMDMGTILIALISALFLQTPMKTRSSLKSPNLDYILKRYLMRSKWEVCTDMLEEGNCPEHSLKMSSMPSPSAWLSPLMALCDCDDESKRLVSEPRSS